MTPLRQENILRTGRTCISALVPLLQDQKSVVAVVRQNTVSVHESHSLQLDLTMDADRQASSKDYSIFNSSIGDEPLIDLEAPSQTQNRPGIKPTAASNHHCLTSTKTSTHTPLLSDMVFEDLRSLLPSSMESPSHQTNMRHADAIYPVCTSESHLKESANSQDKNGDVEPVIGQHVKDDVYGEARNLHRMPTKPVRPSAEPFRRSNQSTSATADVSPLLPEKTEIPSSLGRERRGAKSAVQQVPGEPHVEPPSPRTPVNVSGTFSLYHSNVTSLDHAHVLD